MKRSLTLLCAGFILLPNLGCHHEKKSNSSDPVPAPVPQLTETESERTSRLAAAYIESSPGLGSLDMANPCPGMIDFIQGLQAAVFPRLSLSDISCQDQSTWGSLNYRVDMQVTDENHKASFDWTCSIPEDRSQSTCSGGSPVFGSEWTPAMRSLEDVLRKVTTQFAQKDWTGPLRIFDQDFADYMAKLGEKTRGGLDYREFSKVKGFTAGDSVLQYELIPEGDGLKGQVVFKHVPEAWFTVKTSGVLPMFMLLNCPDMACLETARYEVHGPSLILKRIEGRTSYLLIYKLDASLSN